jgi:peptide deformylase
MTLRTIVYLPDPILRRKARAVTTFGKPLQTLIDDMVETMRAAPGVGLAAPQVSVSERVIVVEYAEEQTDEAMPAADNPVPSSGTQAALEQRPKPKPRLYVIVNPEIVKPSKETVSGVEGCLSVPGLIGEMERNLMVQVKGLNRRGQPVKVKAKGWLARIFQHEVDHVNGVLFTDRALRVWKPEPEEVELANKV